jgi:hypothetical protein
MARTRVSLTSSLFLGTIANRNGHHRIWTGAEGNWGAGPGWVADSNQALPSQKKGDDMAIEDGERGEEGIVAHCTSCRCERVFVRPRIRHLLHVVAAILSGGIWLIGWCAICIEAALRPWRCKNCGWHKPEFRTPLRDIFERGDSALRKRAKGHTETFCPLDVQMDPMDRSPALERLTERLSKRL